MRGNERRVEKQEKNRKGEEQAEGKKEMCNLFMQIFRS